MLWFTNLSLLKKIIIVSILMLISSLSWGAFNGYITYQVMSKDVAERNQFLVESMTSMIANLEKQVADQLRPVSPATGTGLVRLSGGETHCLVQQRHAGADDRHAGAAHHGRGDYHAVFVCRHQPLPVMERHPAGVRRH